MKDEDARAHGRAGEGGALKGRVGDPRHRGLTRGLSRARLDQIRARFHRNQIARKHGKSAARRPPIKKRCSQERTIRDCSCPPQPSRLWRTAEDILRSKGMPQRRRGGFTTTYASTPRCCPPTTSATALQAARKAMLGSIRRCPSDVEERLPVLGPASVGTMNG